jgi:DNA-binding LacI/PurR family transcriptional regulator
MTVIGFYGLTLTEHCWPPLSTVEQPVAEMSVAGIVMLLERIKVGASPARVPTFVDKLVERTFRIGSVAEAMNV